MSHSTSVPSCHGDGPGVRAGADQPVIGLVGAPNVGKSTCFNALTGAKRTVGNWPGTTVEVGSGVWTACHAGEVTVLDLPGAYSLDPLSPDEELTRELILCDDPPDLVVVTVDAVHLARSLYLVAQLREQPLRVVVALTMTDIARRRGQTVDPDALAAALGCPVVAIDPRRVSGLDALGTAVAHALDADLPHVWESGQAYVVSDADDAGDAGEADLAIADARFQRIDAACRAAALADPTPPRTSFSDRVDRWVTAPVLGPVLFLAAMWLVFQITTTVAAPLQDGLDWFFSTPVTDGAQWVFDRLGLGTSPVAGFVIDGLIAGVGMLLTFVPLMALMFLLLALLEDSGYLARAAVVTDKTMRALGLPGRAFLPLIVGFGCNVPAISATRILGNARHRIMTALLVPFTSCSARLTVYVMLAQVFFPDHAGTVVFVMYLVSILIIVAVGFVLRRTLWRTMGTEPLILDLPPYQRPHVRLMLSTMWMRLRGFLQTASGIIVATVALVWVLQSIPAVADASFGGVAVEQSVYGVLAQAIAPVFAPAGFAQWQTVSALIVGFVAKEAVISSWAQTYAVTDPGAGAGGLGEHLVQAFTASSGGHPLPAVAAFMVFLLAYTPCVATLAAQRREIGGRWTAFGIGVQLVVAWLLAVAVFQVGRLIW